MSDATDKHLYGVLEQQLFRLSELPWLTADTKSLGSTEQGPCPISPEKGSTFAELALAKAELEGLRAAANALPTAQLGVRALRCGVRWLEEHLRDVEGSFRKLRSQQDELSDHSPVSPVGRVFNDTSLRKEVLRCLGPGYWLYVAGTSKALRSAYMAVLAAHKNIAVVALRNQVHRVICATSGAAAAQSLSTFRMAQECGIPCGQLGAHSFGRAVGRSGSVELIRLAAAAGVHGNKAVALAGAAETCSIEAIKELYHHRLESDDFGDEDPTGRPKFDEALDAQMTGSVAARGGHLETLRWLMASGVTLFGPYNHDMTTSYAKKSTIYSIMDAAVFSGRLEVVQWLRAQSFAFTAASENLAAALGHLPLLRWLHAQGTELPSATVWAWLRGIGTLVWFTPEMRATLLRNACERGDGAARVQSLLSKGAVWPNDLAELLWRYLSKRCPKAVNFFAEAWPIVPTDERRVCRLSLRSPTLAIGSFGSIGEQGRKLLEAVATEYASRMSVPGGARPTALKGIALAR
ncbi:hypothetical protein JKP88DRAFT_328261 [Tribonema minus]|uniref:Uncharacterized protein n=1 Tax=Tribonema minus TaxID=303371 RepID=A0A835YPX6_9STRA|nr:hypothetical protein JKP88DRAFT_328261 [Tribonema minus]